MKKVYLFHASLVLAVFLFMLITGFSSCYKSQPQQGGDTPSLVMTACSACHPAQKICDKLGTKDKDAWNQTVTRMVGKGANVPAESIPLVVDYLTGLQPGSQPVCAAK